MKIFPLISVIIILILFTLLSTSWTKKLKETEVSFRRLDTSTLRCEKIPPHNVIFYNKEEWGTFWVKNASNNAPEIDFTKYYVAGIFLGVRPNPGYGVEITNIKKKNNEVQIEFTEFLPNPKTRYIQVIVFPCEMIYFSKVDGKITFSGSKKVRE